MHTLSGPRGKFGNAQSHCAGANQGALRREWPAPLPSNATPSRADTVAPVGPPHKRRGLRCTRLHWRRPVLHSRALPTALVRRRSVTELSAWPTSTTHRSQQLSHAHGHAHGSQRLRIALTIVLLILFLSMSGSTQAIEVRLSITISGFHQHGSANADQASRVDKVHAEEPDLYSANRARRAFKPEHLNIIRAQPAAASAATELAMMHVNDMSASAHQALVAQLDDCLQQLPTGYRQLHAARLMAAWQGVGDKAADACLAKLQLLRQWESLNHKLC